MTRDATRGDTPVYDGVVADQGDPEPEMRYRPPTWRELRERGDHRSLTSEAP